MRSIQVLLLLCFCFSATAQTPNTKPFERKGFVFGGAIGISSLQLSSSSISEAKQVGLSFPNFKFGTMVSPRMAILLSLPGTVYQYKWGDRQRDRGFEGILPSVQYWLLDRLWLLGGAGLGLDAPAFYDIKEASERKFYFGTAALAGAGYEVLRRGRFVLDMQGRVHFGSINAPEGRRNGLAFNLMFGFNFY